LQRENDQLKNTLLQFQQTQANNIVSEPVISERSKVAPLSFASFKRQKPFAKGLIILLFCLAAFAGYSMVTSSNTGELQDSIAKLERLNAKRLQDSVANAKIFAATKDSLLEAQERLRAQRESNLANQNGNGNSGKKKKFRLRFW